MTGVAHYQGLSAHFCHPSYPSWRFFAPFPFQVCQFADVMDLDLFVRSAKFAFLGGQALDKFCIGLPFGDGVIIKNCMRCSGERETTKSCNKVSFTLPWNSYFQADEALSHCRGRRSSVLFQNANRACLVFCCQRLKKRPFHHIMELIEAAYIMC